MRITRSFEAPSGGSTRLGSAGRCAARHGPALWLAVRSRCFCAARPPAGLAGVALCGAPLGGTEPVPGSGCHDTELRHWESFLRQLIVSRILSAPRAGSILHASRSVNPCVWV